MSDDSARPVRSLAHLATWPWRRSLRQVRRWKQEIYGMRPPRWWPGRLSGWLGPRHPHDNRSVVIFAGAERFEFLPATSDGYRGHVYHGTLRPSAADVDACLRRQGLPADAARALAVVSSIEGGFDAIQTWDRGKFAWGFIQFTATGGLPRLLHSLKMYAPALFEEYFAAAGVDVDAGQLVIRVNGRTLLGRGAQNRLHDDPAFWRPFLLASRLSTVQDIQVRTAYENYYARPLGQSLTLGSRRVALADFLASNEYGRAVVFDRAVNRGTGYALALFRRAAREAGARSVADGPAVLERVHHLQPRDRWRLDAIGREIPPPRT